jgi:hypothetical protein
LGFISGKQSNMVLIGDVCEKCILVLNVIRHDGILVEFDGVVAILFDCQ